MVEYRSLCCLLVLLAGCGNKSNESYRLPPVVNDTTGAPPVQGAQYGSYLPSKYDKEALQIINANYAVDKGYIGTGIKVAVLDGGVSPQYNGRNIFENRLIQGRNFLADNNGNLYKNAFYNGDPKYDTGEYDGASNIDKSHGTMVAAVLGGKTVNGVSGCAPGVLIVPVRVIGSQNNRTAAQAKQQEGYSDDDIRMVSGLNQQTGQVEAAPLLEGLHYATNVSDISVINMSLGTAMGNTYEAWRLDIFTKAHPEKIFVISLGNRQANDGVMASNFFGTSEQADNAPDNIILVGAFSGTAGQRDHYDDVDDISKTAGFGYKQTVFGVGDRGTSECAPQAAALAAILIEIVTKANPGMSKTEVATLVSNTIKQSATRLPTGTAQNTSPNRVFGWGALNYYRAISAVTRSSPSNQFDLESFEPGPFLTNLSKIDHGVVCYDNNGYPFMASLGALVSRSQAFSYRDNLALSCLAFQKQKIDLGNAGFYLNSKDTIALAKGNEIQIKDFFVSYVDNSFRADFISYGRSFGLYRTPNIGHMVKLSMEPIYGNGIAFECDMKGRYTAMKVSYKTPVLNINNTMSMFLEKEAVLGSSRGFAHGNISRTFVSDISCGFLCNNWNFVINPVLGINMNSDTSNAFVRPNGNIMLFGGKIGAGYSFIGSGIDIGCNLISCLSIVKGSADVFVPYGLRPNEYSFKRIDLSQHTSKVCEFFIANKFGNKVILSFDNAGVSMGIGWKVC